LAESLLNSEMIHYIGSDLHRGLRGGTDLKSILVLIEELSAHKLVAAAAENPECVINGQTFRPENPKPLRRKEKRRGMRGWLQILAGKI
jgi:tyrosine-protein phosphatase YwqE